MGVLNVDLLVCLFLALHSGNKFLLPTIEHAEGHPAHETLFSVKSTIFFFFFFFFCILNMLSAPDPEKHEKQFVHLTMKFY